MAAEKRIRLAGEADIEAIFDIRTSVKENHLSHERLAALGITPVSIRQMILERPCAWIADLDNTPVGFSMADVEDGSVFALFVLPAFEGQGIGRLLLEQAEEFLFRHHQAIWLETDGASRAAGFYRKLGWLAAGTSGGDQIRFEKRRH